MSAPPILKIFIMTNKEKSPAPTKNEHQIILEKIENYLQESISPQELGATFQRVITIIALTLVRNDETDNLNKQWLDDGIFHLSELSEILNNNN